MIGGANNGKRSVIKYQIYKESTNGRRYCCDENGNILQFDDRAKAEKFVNIIKKFHNDSIIEEVEIG